MEEGKDLQKLYGFFQLTFYVIVALDLFVYIFLSDIPNGYINMIGGKIAGLSFFAKPIYTKLLLILIGCLVAIGTKAKKDLEIDKNKAIIYPLAFGLLMVLGSIIFLDLNINKPDVFFHLTWMEIIYCLFSLVGAVLTLTAMDNISKIIKSNFGKDVWNVESESFMQETEKLETETSVNIPMVFYHKKKVHNGYINFNPFRGTFVIGVPGSGKSFGVINPAIRQMISKGFTMCLYDFKFPDLGKIAYYHYLLAKQKGTIPNHKFYVINLNDVEKSCRINPLNKKYIRTLAEASEISDALVSALKKGDSSGGSDQFFTQSAVNFLSSCVYFLAKHEDGKYSSLPHLLAFLNRTYEEIFSALLTNKELQSLLSPFQSALQKKAYDQLEGQVGTLKIFISRLATKESFWVFSDEDFNLKISDKENPAILILASDPQTQNINSALYSLVLNRLTALINDKGNLPTAIVVDELPTLYIHKIENLISTARSNKVAVLLGLQELPQFQQHYGKDASATIQSVNGNILSGAVRNKETLDWLERLFGKIKQVGEGLSIDRSKTSVSLNEKLEALIPAGKIANQQTGEMVGMVARDDEGKEFTGEFKPSAVHCKINLNIDAIKYEENNYKQLPKYYNFKGKKDEVLDKNFEKIIDDIDKIIDQFVNQPV